VRTIRWLVVALAALCAASGDAAWTKPLLQEQPVSRNVSLRCIYDDRSPSFVNPNNAIYESGLVAYRIQRRIITYATYDYRHYNIRLLADFQCGGCNVLAGCREAIAERNLLLGEDCISYDWADFLVPLGKNSLIFLESHLSRFKQKLNVYVNIQSRSSAAVCDKKLEMEVDPVDIPVNRPTDFRFYAKPRPLLYKVALTADFVGFDGGSGAFGRVNEREEYQGGAHSGYQGLPSCETQLPLRALGSIPLGAQVGIVTLLGAAFLGIAAFGCARLLSGFDVGQPSRFGAWALMVVGAPIGLALYSLAGLGDWRAAFWLCNFQVY
jgi:hypothetical protein